MRSAKNHLKWLVRPHERRAQNSCRDSIRWLLDEVTVSESEIGIKGWALVSSGSSLPHVSFLLNNREFEHVDYPRPSPDLARIFWNITTADRARFHCVTTRNEHTFVDGFACFEFLDQADERERKDRLRSAWYLPDPDGAIPVPDATRIARVIGNTDSFNYLLGGASNFKRFDQYLQEKFSRPLKSFTQVLDWGCGSGRVSRHFHTLPKVRLHGVDIDRDNIAWCQSSLPFGQFTVIPLKPETDLPAGHFDLIIGISVFTHLDEESQFQWLEELQRVSRPGAILMLSVQGYALSGLLRVPERMLRQMEKKGFLIKGNNTQLDDVMGSNSHYLDILHSRDYLRQRWSEYFEIVDFVDGLAANQEVVVLRNK